jgi:PAS domain S-box-containing protein
MLYRFLPDWTGEVIAEEAAGELKTRFLGLRFPATDIPSQARALYTSSKIRVLADVQAVPDTLLPAQLPGGGPLDQSHSLLRGFSEVHKLYLGNMGVRATMSLSIVCDGKLWGLIACHHYQPRVPPYHVRNALRRLCELMAEVSAMRIETLTQLASAHEAVALDQLLLNFQQSVLQEEDTKAVLARVLPELLAAFQASALCVRIGDLVYVGGETLTSASDSGVLDEVATRFRIAPPAAGSLQRTDLLTPQGEKLATLPQAAGLLAVRRGTQPLEICAFTRPEVVEEVDWAGAPAKNVTVTPDGQVRLEPRRSFDLWKERVAGTSRPWSTSDLDACERLLRILSDACERHLRKAMELELRFRVHHDHLSSLQRANSTLEREVGERVRAQDNLRQVNETLEVRVADRTAQLAALNQQQVEESSRFAIAADAAGMGFWHLDIAANALHWDERMFRLYGHSPMQGDQPYSLWANSLHPEDRARCEQESADALNGKRAYDTEFRIVHPNGAIRHLRATARIARDADGRAIRMFGVSFDITARKHADEQFRLAIEAAPAGMLLMNSSGSIALVNIQIEKIFGYPRAELLGRDAEMLLPERLRAHPILRNSLFHPAPTRAMGPGEELYGLRKDGSEVPIEIELNPLHTSEGEFVLCSIVDLSQRRDIERMRTDFVSTVSHELRTPLTSISGSLALLQSGVMGALPDKATEMVRIAYSNSGRLVRIINDILDIGKLEAGRLELRLRSMPLADLLRQSVEANLSYAEKCGVRFLLDEEAVNDPVLVDPDRFMQVLANLLSNAAKFSPPGADVLIRARTRAAKLRVEVEDHGPGIPETFQARVFEKFAQADASTTRPFEGTGLGLSIARKLIEAMGGSIGFTTRVGQGTVFHLELPRLDAAAVALRDVQPREGVAIPAALAMPDDRRVGKKVPRLLYVEDDEDLISVIRETLAGRADIVAAHTLSEAERLLAENSFELIILDQALPDGSGISLVDRIPRLVGHSVPIVILSAAHVPDEMHRKVAAVIAKSEATAAHVATTILSYLPLPPA